MLCLQVKRLCIRIRASSFLSLLSGLSYLFLLTHTIFVVLPSLVNLVGFKPMVIIYISWPTHIATMKACKISPARVLLAWINLQVEYHCYRFMLQLSLRAYLFPLNYGQCDWGFELLYFFISSLCHYEWHCLGMWNSLTMQYIQFGKSLE